MFRSKSILILIKNTFRDIFLKLIIDHFSKSLEIAENNDISQQLLHFAVSPFYKKG